MVFYETNTLTGLILSSLPAVIACYLFFVRKQEKSGIYLLVFSAFLIRLLMISLDPYLHPWDERFHALVARHMTDHPFVPMLFTRHIVAYNMEDWGYNHIWVHKQPLFLWQMALSMKCFGVNTFALRLPSAIMGAILVWMVYDLTWRWTKNKVAGFAAAVIAAFAHYMLEMTSGLVSLDHNDLAFLFYMTCSYWAFVRYVDSGHLRKWAWWIGLFAGCAILNKWLTGLLIFGGWGVYLLITANRSKLKSWIHLAFAAGIACVVFLPWQLYIMSAFPRETAISYAMNRKHMTEDLGHPGDFFTHFNFLPYAYHVILIILLIIGIIRVWRSGTISRPLTISFMAMVLVLYGFFSALVATKMPALVYPSAPFLYGFMGFGFFSLVTWLFDLSGEKERSTGWTLLLGCLLMGFISLKPAKIIAERSHNNAFRNKALQHTAVYKQLDPKEIGDRVILNCEPYENIEVMFFQDMIAYHWYPEAHVLDSLKNAGHRFAAFQYHDHPQTLPGWILEDKDILILDKGMK